MTSVIVDTAQRVAAVPSAEFPTASVYRGYRPNLDFTSDFDGRIMTVIPTETDYSMESRARMRADVSIQVAIAERIVNPLDSVAQLDALMAHAQDVLQELQDLGDGISPVTVAQIEGVSEREHDEMYIAMTVLEVTYRRSYNVG